MAHYFPSESRVLGLVPAWGSLAHWLWVGSVMCSNGDKGTKAPWGQDWASGSLAASTPSPGVVAVGSCGGFGEPS